MTMHPARDNHEQEREQRRYRAHAASLPQLPAEYLDRTGFDAAKLAALDAEHDADAQALGVTLLRFQMNTPQDLDATTASVVRQHPDALLLSPNPTNFVLRNELAAFALKPSDVRNLDPDALRYQ